MFLISFDCIDYITYYNFRRFYAQALRKLQSEQYRQRKKKEISLPVELNVYNSLCVLMKENTEFIKHPDNAYLMVIALDIMEQGTLFMQQKQTFMEMENQRFSA